jgi:hypothetical protein
MRTPIPRWVLIFNSFVLLLGSTAHSQAEDPIPFMQDVEGKYTIEVKLLNFGPPEAYTNMADPYVALFHNWRGKTMNGILVIESVSPTQGKVKLTGADDQPPVNLPFRYDAKTGVIALDEKVPQLGGNRIKIDATARLVARGERYASQVEGTLMAIDPQGEQKGWLKFGFKGKAASVLERMVPKTIKPTPPTPPKDTRRRDSGTRFSDLSGQVEICRYDYDLQKHNEDTKDVAKMGMIIYVDDLIITGEDSGAILSFSDMTTYQMGAETRVVCDTPPERDSKIKLLMGNIWVNIKKMIKDGTMEVHMSQAVCGIKGTIFTCTETGTSSEVKVLEGAVTMKHIKTGKEQLVSAGQTLVATSEGLSEPTPFDVPSERAKWTKPSARTTPRPAPTPISGPWVHPSKTFQLNATQGWGHVPNYRNTVADQSADTLIDSSQQIALTLMRHPNSVLDARTAFGRWLAGISRSLTQPGMRDLRVETITLGGSQGWRVCYRLDSPLVISRLFFVHHGQAFILNALYPSDFGQAELPHALSTLLDSLEMTPEVVTTPATSLGSERFRSQELEQFSRDFSIIAYERGVVLKDSVANVEQVVQSDQPIYNIDDNVANLLEDDPDLRDRLGKATTPVIGMFDYRFKLQLYENGCSLHDPVTSLVWVKAY